MERDIFCGKHRCQEAVIEDSQFINVGMGRVLFDNVDLSHARVHNINMGHMTIECVQLGGTTFRHVGLPPDQRAAEVQDPLTFEDCDFNRSTFAECNLSGISLNGCNLDGARIDGVLVSELLESHGRTRQGVEGGG